MNQRGRYFPLDPNPGIFVGSGCFFKIRSGHEPGSESKIHPLPFQGITAGKCLFFKYLFTLETAHRTALKGLFADLTWRSKRPSPAHEYFKRFSIVRSCGRSGRFYGVTARSNREIIQLQGVSFSVISNEIQYFILKRLYHKERKFCKTAQNIFIGKSFQETFALYQKKIYNYYIDFFYLKKNTH